MRMLGTLHRGKNEDVRILHRGKNEDVETLYQVQVLWEKDDVP